MSPLLEKLSGAVTEAVSEIWKERIEYEPTQVALHFDSLTRKNPIAAFSIQRRVDSPFDQNKYFSEAPLPTETHLHSLRRLSPTF